MLLSVIPEKRHLIQHERWKIYVSKEYCTQYLNYMESLMLNGRDNAAFNYFQEKLLSQSTSAKPATSRSYIPVHTGSESEQESDSDDEDPQNGPKRKRGKPRNNKAQKNQKTGR
jgi:hypothetical protein